MRRARELPRLIDPSHVSGYCFGPMLRRGTKVERIGPDEMNRETAGVKDSKSPNRCASPIRRHRVRVSAIRAFGR